MYLLICNELDPVSGACLGSDYVSIESLGSAFFAPILGDISNLETGFFGTLLLFVAGLSCGLILSILRKTR